ncbi:MAG: glutamine-hydrolyzing carbamoyl-phosphate synthase small subunit [Phycisphaerae bacterium]
MPDRRIARLALEDGAVFTGSAFGAQGTTDGEVVFNTSLTGYQEILTDPSYAGQIVTMTYPLIGNVGVNDEDAESRRPFVAGFVIKELPPLYSNWRATESLDAYLARHDVVGIAGIDTRALVRRIRTGGAMRGVLDTTGQTAAELVAKAKQAAAMSGADWVSRVKPAGPVSWEQDHGLWRMSRPSESGQSLHVVALDCGAKHNILRHFADRGVKLTVVPPDTTPEEILALKPDGLFISNGPGDPAAVGYVVEHLRQLLQQVPTFGICLGHQLLGRAVGAETFKLKFGHRGGNQPVRHLATGRVEITSQNHGFAVEEQTLERAGGVVTHVNLNDGTVEGFRHKDLPVFSVQYHPEASPGPHDAAYLFDAFVEMMKSKQPVAGERLAELQSR